MDDIVLLPPPKDHHSNSAVLNMRTCLFEWRGRVTSRMPPANRISIILPWGWRFESILWMKWRRAMDGGGNVCGFIVSSAFIDTSFRMKRVDIDYSSLSATNRQWGSGWVDRIGVSTRRTFSSHIYHSLPLMFSFIKRRRATLYYASSTKARGWYWECMWE